MEKHILKNIKEKLIIIAVPKFGEHKDLYLLSKKHFIVSVLLN